MDSLFRRDPITVDAKITDVLDKQIKVKRDEQLNKGPRKIDNIKKLTLRELYDMITPQLEKYGDKPVTIEGCDCNGDVGYVEFPDEGCYIGRTDSSYR